MGRMPSHSKCASSAAASPPTHVPEYNVCARRACLVSPLSVESVVFYERERILRPN